MATVDLDALEAELSARIGKDKTFDALDIIWRHVSPEPSREISQAMAEAFWSAREVYSHSNDADVDTCKRLDELSEVIDAQLSLPEPSRGATVDVDAVMELVGKYGYALAEWSAYEGDPDDAEMWRLVGVRDGYLAAIRALLEPHDAARLREAAAKAAFDSQRKNRGEEYGSVDWDRISGRHREGWLEIADAVIRAIGGAR